VGVENAGRNLGNTGMTPGGMCRVWGLAGEGRHLVCPMGLPPFHHQSRHFPTPGAGYAVKKGTSRAKEGLAMGTVFIAFTQQ
jgi:hypothetical protein